MHQKHPPVLHVVFILIAVGLAWVVLSTDLLWTVLRIPSPVALYYSYTEIFYVLVTAALVYVLVDRMLDRQSLIEQDLRESEHRLQLFIEHAPAALAMFDRQMRYLSVSNRWLQDYDLGGQNVIGRSHYEVFPEIPARWKILHQRGLEGEVLYSDDDRLQRSDGSLQRLRWEVRPWYANDGRVGGIVIFSEDITARKMTEAALLSSERKYRTLFEHSRDALMILVAPSWHCTASNQAALRLFQLPDSAALAAATPWALSPPMQPDGQGSEEKAHKMLAMALQEGAHHFEWLHSRPDGSTFSVEVQLTRMELSGEDAVLASVRDISARKALEKQLGEHRREMESLQKRQVAAQTAAAFAHELNQPLLAIATYNQASLMLLDSTNPDFSRIREAIEASERQALRAGHAIRELLDSLTISEFATDTFDINQEILDVLDIARREHELQFQTRLMLAPRLPPVKANRTHVQKVLLNLLHNGIEAMLEAGIPLPDLTVSVTTKRDEGLIQITLQDSGPGLSAEIQRRLFEPFYTTKSNGIGMGLSISRSLIQANGGQLWVDPHEGPGAVFHLTLPLAG
ncbi:MAG: PAS domain S-box protein [Betaproteobacteria bacterium]|nr:PAS domain S-box protein [Betaproteobacteria bacterium]